MGQIHQRGLTGEPLQVLHVGEVERGPAHQGVDMAIGHGHVLYPGGGFQPIGGDEEPDGAIMVDRHIGLLREVDRGAIRPHGITADDLPGLALIGNARQYGKGFPEQVELVGRARIRAGVDQAGIHLLIRQPEAMIDGLLERAGPLAVAGRQLILAQLGGQTRRQP
ncbi:hypothetical protein D3C72_1007530 [compost metagenome]